MRRTVIVAVLVLAWMIGPVARVQDGDASPPAPEPLPTMTISR